MRPAQLRVDVGVIGGVEDQRQQQLQGDRIGGLPSADRQQQVSPKRAAFWCSAAQQQRREDRWISESADQLDGLAGLCSVSAGQQVLQPMNQPRRSLLIARRSSSETGTM
ncbi:MAG: hypothetical protein P8R54_01320 [Myxococcota bacterium]|nr:hypothetical protein [Myxococcota bacterium]